MKTTIRTSQGVEMDREEVRVALVKYLEEQEEVEVPDNAKFDIDGTRAFFYWERSA